MNMIRHDNVTSDKPRRLRCPSRAQQLMGCVVRQNLFALFCADHQEHNDLSVMTLNSWKVGRMFTSNVVHALGRAYPD